MGRRGKGRGMGRRRRRGYRLREGGWDGAASGINLVGNASAVEHPRLLDWIASRHHKAKCTWATPVYFAPFSPNGIGNKLMAMVMAFHIALMTCAPCCLLCCATDPCC